ncbi:hypothetical protein N9318_05290 [Euryarchaeota archaeon]|nr:hypothetical protein [Euryarchaeota archaeon]
MSYHLVFPHNHAIGGGYHSLIPRQRVPFRLSLIGWGAVAICNRIRRDENIVHSSSLLAKGFFPETHIQMMNKIRIKIRIAVMNAVPFSPKNFNEVKKVLAA